MGPIAVLVGGGRIDDAGDVPGATEHETHRPTDQLGAGIGRSPRCDVILVGREEINWGLDLAQVDGHAGQGDATRFTQQVLLVHVAHVEAVHVARHARGIGVPVQQIEGIGILAQQVVVDHEIPDQIIGAQHAEHPGHLAAIEIAALTHLLFQQGNQFLVDEHFQFARRAEIGHAGKADGALHPLILMCGQPGQG